MHRPRTARVKKARQRRWPGWVATDERWERMIAKIDEEVRLGKQTKNPPRYLTVEACWKRNVYAFALANTQSEAESHSLHLYTEGLISGNPHRRLPRKPSFALNSFHWVITALAADGKWNINRQKVFRFGRHLLYAKQHRVPEEFLIGFLYQAGTPSAVEKKAGSGATEVWRDRWITAQL